LQDWFAILNCAVFNGSKNSKKIFAARVAEINNSTYHSSTIKSKVRNKISYHLKSMVAEEIKA
jgi:hypothetical protein